MRVKFLSANNRMHFAWYHTNQVSAGTSQDHQSKRQPQSFTIAAFNGQRRFIEDLVSISSNDKMHFAWYFEPDRKGRESITDIWVCSGPSNALGAKHDWYPSALPLEAHRDNILFITANNSTHFVWYKKGKELWVGRGSSDDLSKLPPLRCGLPQNVKFDHILHIASNDAMHFVYLRKGTYIAGPIEELDKIRSGFIYDHEKLGLDLLKS